MFKLEIKTDNAAFDDLHEEVARVLEKAANKVRYGSTSVVLLDSNGNRVGLAEFVEDEE